MKNTLFTLTLAAAALPRLAAAHTGGDSGTHHALLDFHQTVEPSGVAVVVVLAIVVVLAVAAAAVALSKNGERNKRPARPANTSRNAHMKRGG